MISIEKQKAEKDIFERKQVEETSIEQQSMQPVQQDLLGQSAAEQASLEQNTTEEKDKKLKVQEQLQESFGEVVADGGTVQTEAKKEGTVAQQQAPAEPQYIGISKKFQKIREGDDKNIAAVRVALQNYRLSRGSNAELYELNKLIEACGTYHYNVGSPRMAESKKRPSWISSRRSSVSKPEKTGIFSPEMRETKRPVFFSNCFRQSMAFNRYACPLAERGCRFRPKWKRSSISAVHVCSRAFLPCTAGL